MQRRDEAEPAQHAQAGRHGAMRAAGKLRVEVRSRAAGRERQPQKLLCLTRLLPSSGRPPAA